MGVLRTIFKVILLPVWLVFGIVVIWPLGILAHLHTSLTYKPWKRLTGR